MTHYKNFSLLFLIILLFVFCVSAQKPKPKQNKQTNNSSRQIADPRTKPPASRRFNHRFNIDFNYDKFENKTKVQLKLPINSIDSVHFAYFFVGEKLKQSPKEIILLFFKDSDKEFLFPVKDFVVLTDKDRFRIKMVEATELQTDGKIPYIATIDYSTFLRIANAEKIDMKIGDYVITFDDESLEALKEFASRTSPNFKESEESVENQAIEKQIRDEVDNLYRTNSFVKSKIREIIDDMKQALTVSESSATAQTKQKLVGQASRTYLEQKDMIPDGLFKELLDSCMKDLVRADVLNGVKAGIIDKKSFDTTEIIREYNLSSVPESKHSVVILSNARETLIQIFTLASMAKIIE